MAQISIEAQHGYILSEDISINELNKTVDANGDLGKSKGGILLPFGNFEKDTASLQRAVSVGPGTYTVGTFIEPYVKEGEVFITNLIQLCHEFTTFGRKVKLFNWYSPVGKINQGEEGLTLEACGAHVVTVPNEDAEKAFFNGQGSLIHLPGSGQNTGAADGPREQLRVVLHEVVGVGPGGIIDGAFQKPTVQPGDFVLFSTNGGNPLDFTFYGKKYTFVQWKQVLLRVRVTEDGEFESY